jgi:hypothetical protein
MVDHSIRKITTHPLHRERNSELNKNAVFREKIVNFKEKNMMSSEHTYLDSFMKKCLPKTLHCNNSLGLFFIRH